VRAEHHDRASATLAEIDADEEAVFVDEERPLHRGGKRLRVGVGAGVIRTSPSRYRTSESYENERARAFVEHRWAA